MPSIPSPEVLETLVAAGLTGNEPFLRSLVFPTTMGTCNACGSWSMERNNAIARIRGMEGASSYNMCARHVAEYAAQRISRAEHNDSTGFHNNFGHLAECAICSQPGYARYYPGRQYRGVDRFVHTSCSDQLVRCSTCRDYRLPSEAGVVCCAPGTRCLNCRERYTRDDQYAYRPVVRVAGGRTLADGTSSDALDWCESCFADNYAECGDCNAFHVHNYLYSRYHGSVRVCHTCFDADEAYERCGRHGYVYRGDGPECCSGEQQLINSYSFRPRLRYRGDGPVFLGMELEVECNRDRYYAARVAREAFGNLVYLKEDGSIRSGFEMVTHPMTAQWFVENYNFDALTALSESGAYAADNCGIHVHVSKAGFSGAAHDYRWLAFMAKNEQAITTLARRSSSYARFGGTSVKDRKDIATKRTRGGYDRYSAVNVNNTHTYEVRVFASSLNAQTVGAAVLFVDASVEYTRQLRSAAVIRSNGWGWAAFVAWLETAGERYAMLRAELTSLGIGMPADPSEVSNLDTIVSTARDVGYGERDSDDDGYGYGPNHVDDGRCPCCCPCCHGDDDDDNY